MKKILSTALLMMLALTVTASAANNPMRLARLPIIILSPTPDEDTMMGLELKISRAIHLPLNGTLQAIEYIPTKESTEALQKVWDKIYKDTKKVRLQEAMEPLAKKLNADLVVCPVLRRFSQHMMISTGLSESSENHMVSNVEVELIIYDRNTKELTSKKASRYYNGEDIEWGTARFLSVECMTKVIEQTALRDKVLSYTPIGERKPVERQRLS